MARGRKSEVEVTAFNVTLDADHASFLDMIVRTGRHGRSRSDAAAQIIREWLNIEGPGVLENYERLKSKAEKGAI